VPKPSPNKAGKVEMKRRVAYARLAGDWAEGKKKKKDHIYGCQWEERKEKSPGATWGRDDEGRGGRLGLLPNMSLGAIQWKEKEEK